MGRIVIRPAASPVLVRAHKSQIDAQRTSPITVQNARKMGVVRTAGFLELLETYKKTQQSTLDAQKAQQEAGKKEEERTDEPDVPQAARGSAPPLLTLQDQMLEVAKEQEAERKLGVDRFRVKKHVCPNPQCQDPTAQPEVDADGNSVCPNCGYSDENAAPEFEGAGQQDISDLEGGNRRTFLQDGGADNRTGQEWQDDANRELYVLEARDVHPSTTAQQLWWTNNRMNQAMVWADYMGADRGLPGGFAIAYDEIERIKRILRAVCIFMARFAPKDDDDDDGDEEDEVEEGKPDFGSPLLWTVLLTLEMIAQRQDGFMVATEAMQATSTVRALHAYMRKFQSAQAKRYVEMLGAFRTRAKGVEAKLAQQKLDRVKVRQAAWHSLGNDPAKLAAKVKTLNALLKKSGVFGQTAQGEPIGLSEPVMRGEPPGLLEARANQITKVEDLALNKGTYQPLLVDRAKEQAKGLNFFRQKEWDRADASLLKRERKAQQSASDSNAVAQDDEQPSTDDDEDSEDDEFSGLKLSKQDRRIIRQNKNAQQQKQWSPVGPQPQQPVQNLSRLEDAPSQTMDVDPAPAPSPSAPPPPPASAGGASSSSGTTSSDAPNAQLANLDNDALQVEIATQISTIEAMQRSGTANAEYMEMLDQQLREMQAELQRRMDEAQKAAAPPPPRTSLEEFDVDVFAEFDDNTDGGGGGGGGDADAGSAMRPEPAAYDSGNAPTPGIADTEGVITELPGMDEDEDRVADRALLLSLDLSPEAFEEQQRLIFNQMMEEDAERRARLQLQAEEEAASRAAAQEEKEAVYRQDGVYDRAKDPRNNLELGMKTATPSYEELLQQGRKPRPEYKGKRVIRALTYAEVVGSRNYHQKGFGFVREWQQLQREWRAEQAAKLERLQDAEAIKEASRQKRLAEAAARQVQREADEARKEQGRRTAEENRYQKSENKMVAEQRRRQGKYTLNARESSTLNPVIRKAENKNLMLDRVAQAMEREASNKRKAEEGEEAQEPEVKKKYEYECSDKDCRRTRVVFTKPKPGWNCFDGGFACRRRYNCKSCKRPLFKEGDPDDAYECKDLGKECIKRPKK